MLCSAAAEEPEFSPSKALALLITFKRAQSKLRASCFTYVHPLFEVALGAEWPCILSELDFS